MLTGLLFSRAFCRPPESRPEQWDPWRAPIGQWGPVSAPTGCVAHWYIIAHHGCSWGVPRGGFCHLPPHPPLPIPPHPATYPTHPLYYQY